MQQGVVHLMMQCIKSGGVLKIELTSPAAYAIILLPPRPELSRASVSEKGKHLSPVGVSMTFYAISTHMELPRAFGPPLVAFSGSERARFGALDLTEGSFF